MRARACPIHRQLVLDESEGEPYCFLCDVFVMEPVECDDSAGNVLSLGRNRVAIGALRRLVHEVLDDPDTDSTRFGLWMRLRDELAPGLPATRRLVELAEEYGAKSIRDEHRFDEPWCLRPRRRQELGDIENALAAPWEVWARRFAEHGLLDLAIGAYSQVLAWTSLGRGEAHLELAALFARKGDEATRQAHFEAAVELLFSDDKTSGLRRYIQRVPHDYCARAVLARHLISRCETTCGLQEYLALERELEALGRPDPWREVAREIVKLDPAKTAIAEKLKTTGEQAGEARQGPSGERA